MLKKLGSCGNKVDIYNYVSIDLHIVFNLSLKSNNVTSCIVYFGQ